MNKTTEIIVTKSFQLAVYKKGKEDAEKLALLLPGRLDTKDYAHMKSHVDFLAEKGYLAVSFDPPGTWESPGMIEEYTMTNYLKAINELIAYFGNKPTIIIGHSRGGTMAMLAGTQNSCITHIVAIMSHTLPSDLTEEDEKKGFVVSVRDTPGGGEITFKLPINYYVDAKKYDILSSLKTCTKPKLLVYGEKDNLVEPYEVKEIFAASAEPKQLAKVDSEHDYRKHPESIEEVNKIIETFLDMY